jgi:hypothetical protein
LTFEEVAIQSKVALEVPDSWLNFTPWRLAIFTLPRTIFAANFVSVGKVMFF